MRNVQRTTQWNAVHLAVQAFGDLKSTLHALTRLNEGKKRRPCGHMRSPGDVQEL